MDGQKIFLQFGCGWSAPAGWLNYDSSPTLRFERIPFLGTLYTKNSRRFPEAIKYGDIVKGLPHPDNSVHAIYASHVLEHLPLDDVRIALGHVLAMLCPQGTFRLVVPDLHWRAALYIENLSAGQVDASDQFMRDCTLGAESHPRGLLRKAATLWGGSAHQWMWDELSMTRELTAAGFIGIRRCTLGDAVDPEFRGVEDPERFFDRGHPELAMEARKPA